jgi:hypothetical protein
MKAHVDLLPWGVLQACVLRNDVPGMRALLQTLVPGYAADGAVVDYVSMARANGPKMETF